MSALPVALASCTGSGGRTSDHVFAFLSRDEAAFLDAALDRLIPSDALGPGAREANVLGFLDLQLAGAYGRADRWYMQGPWAKGTHEQGFQLRLTPAEIYRSAIAGTDAYCGTHHGGPFRGLRAADQDQVLHALEDGRAEIGDVPSDTFFSLLWQNTLEGFLSDPAYGGNRDFAGWKLIGFPGPRYDYLDDIGKFGERYTQPCVSIDGRRAAATTRLPRRKDV